MTWTPPADGIDVPAWEREPTTSAGDGSAPACDANWRNVVMAEAALTALPDAEALAERVAAWILERVLRLPRRVSVCLSGGSTPRRLYQTVAESRYRDRMPWQRIHWFWGDERFVPSNDARSNYRMVREAWLDRIAAPVESVHPIPTDGLTLERPSSPTSESSSIFTARMS
jgi:hypothetical protein